MTIAASQRPDFTRSLIQEPIQAAPKGKIQLDEKTASSEAIATGPASDDFAMLGDDGLSFWDVLDVINPLQHIPVVNSIYRELTGDEIDPAMKLAGGGLFGGFLGLGLAAVDVAVDGMTGKDIGEHAIALATGDFETDNTATATAVAESKPAANPVTSATATEQQVAVAPTPTLPEWGQLPRTHDDTADSLTSTAPHNVTLPLTKEAKSFPAPRRSSINTESAKSVAALRADANAGVTTGGGLTAAPQLSPEAMRTAGLTQDMVSEILQRHTQPAQNSAKPADENEDTPAKTVNTDTHLHSNAMDKSATGVENTWLYSTMTQALDKYQAAQTLAPMSADGAVPATTRTLR